MTTVTKKIDTLPAATTVANNDKLVILDVSESAVDMTKLATMSQIPISLASQLGADVVEEAVIKNGAVTGTKIANDAVDSQHYAADSIDAEHYAPDSVDYLALKKTSGSEAVTTATIRAANVTLAKMAANSIDSDQYVDGSIDRVHLAADIVDGTKIADDAVDSEHIKDGAIDLAHMSVNSIDSDQYVDGSIDTVHLANDAVTEAKLGAIKRTVAIPIFGLEDDITAKNFARVFAWPPSVNGHIVTAAHAVILGAVSTSGGVGITLTNQNGTMATITVAQSAWSASAASISSSYYTAQSFATFSVNVTAAGSGAKGLTIFLEITG